MDNSERHLSVYQYQHSLKLVDSDSSDINDIKLQDTQSIPNLTDKKNDTDIYYKSVDEF